MEKTTQNKVKRICITGLMAALIAVATAFIKMPTGINSGYLHFGDSMIYLAGCLLGPWASLAAAIGGGIAEEFYGGTGFDDEALLKRYLDDRLYRIVKM